MNTGLFLKLGLAPLVIPQAIWVRRHALILPEATGPRSGRTGSGAPLRLLVIGDSSAAGVGVEHQDQALLGRLTQHLSRQYDTYWNLHAKTGATTASTLQSLQKDPPPKADIAVVALGVNDVTGLVPLRRWLTQQAELRDYLRDRFGVKLIYLSALPPIGHFPLLPQPTRWLLGRIADQFDDALKRAVAQDQQTQHVRIDLPLDPSLMAKDGFHPGPKIYATWGQELATQIAQDWGHHST